MPPSAIRAAQESASVSTLLVSDNSDPESRRDLEERTADLTDSRLSRIATTRALSMTDHWNWALEAIRESDITHVLVLTDRMRPRPGALADLMEIVKRFR